MPITGLRLHVDVPDELRARGADDCTLTNTTMFFRSFGLLLLAAAAQASILTLQSPRFVVTDDIGTQLRAEP